MGDRVEIPTLALTQVDYATWHHLIEYVGLENLIVFEVGELATVGEAVCCCYA